MSQTYNILLADDHPIVREGLAQLIEQHDDFNVCGEAEDADQAMEAVEKFNPDLAVVDVSLANSNGLILLTGGPDGPVSNHPQAANAMDTRPRRTRSRFARIMRGIVGKMGLPEDPPGRGAIE